MFSKTTKFIVGLTTVVAILHPPTIAYSMPLTNNRVNYAMNPDKFLTVERRDSGAQLKLPDETEFYASGNPKSKFGVILIPDTKGWDSGRIRDIADYYAENDCYAVIPKLMGSIKTNDISTKPYVDSFGIGDYAKSQIIDGNLKPKICSLVRHMQQQGVTKIALVGFSWGGWVVANILSSDISESFVCGVLAHASINLEERLYGGSIPELFSKLNRPILLMPARGDPYDYKAFVDMIKYKLPTSEVVDFHNLEHNFLLVGSMEDPDTRRGCSKALSESLGFMKYHFSLKLSDFVFDAAKGTEKLEESRKSWVQSTQDTLSDVGKKIGATTQEYGKKIEETSDPKQKK